MISGRRPSIYSAFIKLINFAKKLVKLRKQIILFVLFASVVAFSSYFIARQESQRSIEKFNTQAIGITKYATSYLVDNFDLYYQNPTFIFQNLGKDFLNNNKPILSYQIFDTEGNILYDTQINRVGETKIKVSGEILEASRGWEPEYYYENSRIAKAVVPYFMVEGIHKYSVVYNFSFEELNRSISQYNFDVTIIAILMVLSASALIGAYIAYEQIKVHTERKEKLEALDRERQEFIQLAAHNLRTPISIIKGYVNLIDDTKLDKETKKNIIPIDDATSELSELSEEMLTISYLLDSNAKININDKVGLDEIILPVLEKYQKKIIEKEIKIETNIEKTKITTNGAYLKMIINSLLDNAVKFNKKSGKIVINVTEKGKKVIVSIADTGIGIGENEKSRLFTMFHRSSDKNLLVYSYEGAGLGLYMSKLIVQALRGEIQLESELGKGTTFYITLPKNNQA